MAKIAYPCVTTLDLEVYPVDPETGRDIEDLGLGTMVEMWIPNSRRADVDRNDSTRRELAIVVKTALTEAEGS